LIKMAHDIDLTDLERDALTELVNIGVSQAATNLRGMIGEELLFSVPLTTCRGCCGG
jgi:chemotaxis protein CheC